MICDRLSNGMKVVRIDRPGWPVVTADVWVSTGSAFEDPAEAGISHFLEHMMFKGTATRGPGELDRIVEGVGGHWNAGTSKDFTHYYLTVPSEQIALAIDALSDAVLRSLIDPEEVERERQVILEEWRRSEDSPGQRLYTEVYSTSLASGSYRWPVLGTKETIESISRDGLAAYHRARYTPDNMTLFLAGPVGDAKVLDLVNEFFTWKEKAPKSQGNGIGGSEWQAGAVKTVPKGVGEVHLAITWPGPSAEDTKAMTTMDVTQYILGQGRASRLYLRLREKQRLVTTISAIYPAHLKTGMFMVFASCAADKASDARAAIVEEVCAIADEGPEANEVTRAKRLLTSHHVFGHETTSGHTSSLGYHHVLTGDLEFDDKYPDLVKKVTKASVTKWAKEYLKPELATAVAIHPKNHPLDWGAAS